MFNIDILTSTTNKFYKIKDNSFHEHLTYIATYNFHINSYWRNTILGKLASPLLYFYHIYHA